MISEECQQWKGVEQVRCIYNKRMKVLTVYFCSRESSGVSGRISKHFVRKQSRRFRCSGVQPMSEVSVNKKVSNVPGVSAAHYVNHLLRKAIFLGRAVHFFDEYLC